MSGRVSPDNSAELGLPDDIYINPDNVLPPASTAHVSDEDIHDLAPARGASGKKPNKLKGIFKKGKKDSAPAYKPGGASQLGDVLGKSGASSSVGSRDSSRHEVAMPSRHDTADHDKSSRMAGFKDFFKKKPEDKTPLRTSGQEQHSATMDSMRTTVMNFFRGPVPPGAPTSPTTETEIAPLKAPPPRSPCRISIVMFVMFGLMVIIGIILLAMGMLGDSRSAEHCVVLGPIFLSLGCFLIIGEVFFMMFWMEDPMPCLGNCMEKINAKIGGIADPYGLKRPETYQPQRASYYPGLRLSAFLPPASPTARETIPMKTMYSGAYDTGYATGDGPSGPAAFDSPSGPAAFDYDPPGYQRARSHDSSNTSYQNSSFQDDSYANPARII